jgi:hypothetical protein
MTISGIELQEFGNVRVGLVAADSRELTNVSIGRDYLQGVLEDGHSIGLIQMSEITRLEYLVTTQAIKQGVNFSPKTLSEQIQKIQVPCLAKLRTRQQPSALQTHWFLGETKGLLIFEGNPNYFIPLASVGFIELGCG